MQILTPLLLDQKETHKHIEYSEEATLLKEVLKTLRGLERYGIKVIRVVDRYTKGYSDLLICARGRFVAAELKDDTGRPSMHQTMFVEDIIKAGGIGSDSCKTVNDVLRLIHKAVFCECNSSYEVDWLDYPDEVEYCAICGKERYV